MLRFVSYDVVFSEVPGEVTLALNLSNCPNRCKGCHSPHLWEDTGEVLDGAAMAVLLRQYGAAVTCVCFMGGDAEPLAVAAMARYVKCFGREAGVSATSPAGGVPAGSAPAGQPLKPLKTAWYSGRAALPADFPISDFDYLKTGPYIEALGGLKSETTNQRFYRVEPGNRLVDITAAFWRKGL